MLVYTSHGTRDFGTDPATPKMRSAWEFWAMLRGNVTFNINANRTLTICNPTLLLFPPDMEFGCTGTGVTQRAVFDFNAVPTEISQALPQECYYHSLLDNEDSCRIRKCAELAEASINRPTQFALLQQQAVLAELSLLALRELKTYPLRGQDKAQAKVDQAIAWYASSMAERPTLKEMGEAISVSTAHIRRFFHQVKGKNPKAVFNELRMQRAEVLLTQTPLCLEEIAAQVSLADASALSRAVKKHFGMTPGQLRALRRRQRENGY